MKYEKFVDNLHYLYVAELRELAERFDLDTRYKKAELIAKIAAYVKTGEKILPAGYPKSSLAHGIIPPLLPESKMLKGAYKNDLATRGFFKKLIGSHFHFTVFGLDWLERRWQEGKPPTYQEFADMWAEEYELRKKFPAPPKAEWKYIMFVQDYLKKNKNCFREELLNAWNRARVKAVKDVYEFCKAAGLKNI